MEEQEERSPVYTARGAIGGEDWAAVADAVNQRMAARRIGQQELADISGVSVSTVRQIQHGGKGRRVQNKTLTALARALDWPGDHLIRVLVGDQAPDVPAGATMREILAGIDRIEQQLADMSHRMAAVEELVTAQGAGR
ncbi:MULTISPECIES: helix-turn-helix transcriptional regulator [Protofrankia]|uniref:Transcriptional regulator n=1 Tax=Protofrankia coriariae TaxID=1562887 RepID=A0ABR5EYL4_9ACTN|nr:MULTISPECIES: helix-turn-helix domain-containing protein [Protofrankia]KLL09539.1 transcriptional regulator [Protofrankia coriariae]ONH33266.1 XRE family transcriptional regulator [Protofrankia sp. BMG5.30]